MSEHYFSSNPESAAHEHPMKVRLRGREYQVTGSDGVFAGNRVDKGTSVFLDKVPDPQVGAGQIALDLGCGWGPLTIALGAHAPQAELWAVDVNERALSLTKRNTHAAGVEAHVATPEDALAQLADREIRLIWSNPPIRIGKAALHELLGTWLAKLSADGEAFLVVQKNLGADSLARWLRETGWECAKIGSAKGFRILRVARS
ncbi:16S rRNA m(2)G 1207 methyltransferase [Actinobaculum suis]|uniref:16S rRNA m(2)G 1207 methyltransferase n=1 Tax=Actinobaculum suis TaxID=1657 RepID=A0A7Z8YAW8_9ACTO|nr:methyltransferase [Actinobaculum suis]OCA96306.1 methyltransferase [Actinobaculum suis]VDG76766.1 16S rRNA m(2)G 1207 methyltransferase [Actinobaculum suis]